MTPLWRATQVTLDESSLPPPYWAFAWPGGQALARYLLDHPDFVRDKRVLDFASGSGLVAIAAASAGAAQVTAADIDPFATAAIALNARVNGARIAVLGEDPIDGPSSWDAILAGDVCYEQPMAGRVIPWLRKLADRGIAVLLADPGRTYVPTNDLAEIARYQVPTSLELEDRQMRETVVWRLLPSDQLEARHMTSPGDTVGTIAELWRYPVQSMGGENLQAVELIEDGIVGDRAYGLVDPEIDKVVSSAQGKRKWRDIVTFSARYLEAPTSSAAPKPVEIELPGGVRLRSDQADLDERLSAVLGAPVHFADKARENKKSSYSHEPLHVLATASLKQFSRHHPEGRFVAARFRPNLVIDTGNLAGFAEQSWIGQRFRIGESLAIAITEHCKRCVMTTLPQGDLPFDSAILHTVNQQNGAHAGVYAAVVQPGTIKVGDPVRRVD